MEQRSPLLAPDEAAFAAAERGAARAPQKYAAHPLRWLVLFTFSLMGALQGAVWVIPGCLAANFAGVYRMDQDTVSC